MQVIDGLHLKPYLGAEALQQRIAELAQTLNERYAGQTSSSLPVLMPVLSGALRFTAALLPMLDFAYDVNCVKISTYGEAQVPVEAPRFQLGFTLDLEQRQVIVLEDILDTGATLSFLHQALQSVGALPYTAVLLRKPAGPSPQPPPPPPPDWVGFTAPDAFLVGFGLDYSGRLRHLQEIFSLV